MELRYADVSEMYRTLERHSVSIEAQELVSSSFSGKVAGFICVRETKDFRD